MTCSNDTTKAMGIPEKGEAAMQQLTSKRVLAELTQGSGVRWRGRLLGPGRAVAELRTPWPCLVYDDAPIGVKSRMAAS
jgi:hypothetical protein